MRRALIVFTLAVAACGVAPLVGAEESGKPVRVVVQVSDADPVRWNLALTNVKNLQDEFGPGNVRIEIVAYGPGIGMLRSDAVTSARIAEAVRNGVAVEACENSMRNQKLARADMHPSVAYVAAGVVQIVQRQQDDWAYLRP